MPAAGAVILKLLSDSFETAPTNSEPELVKPLSDPTSLSQGAELDDEVFACRAKACPRDHLCIGCIFTCANCTEDFCEQHIVAIDREHGFADYFCQPCLTRRLEAALLEQEAA